MLFYVCGLFEVVYQFCDQVIGFFWFCWVLSAVHMMVGSLNSVWVLACSILFSEYLSPTSILLNLPSEPSIQWLAWCTKNESNSNLDYGKNPEYTIAKTAHLVSHVLGCRNQSCSIEVLRMYDGPIINARHLLDTSRQGTIALLILLTSFFEMKDLYRRRKALL